MNLPKRSHSWQAAEPQPASDLKFRNLKFPPVGSSLGTPVQVVLAEVVAGRQQLSTFPTLMPLFHASSPSPSSSFGLLLVG
jgi:hypothetical protein